MQIIFKKFHASRRGAIAMIFALCLLPIVLVIGLAIDYSFYVQAKQQVSRAAEAAATQAVRTAAAGYALDIDNGDSVTTATSDAISEGETAGQQWFLAQAGRLVSGSANTTSVSVAATTSSGAGFSSTVYYKYSYPPFFNSLFNRSTPWVYSSSSQAQAVFQYVEVLLLLDTSGSMQIPADTTDVQTLSKNSVCFPSTITDTYGLSPLLNDYPDAYSAEMQTDGDAVDFSDLYSATQPSVLTYLGENGQAPTSTSGMCNTPNYGVVIGNDTASQPGAPCALACHTTTSKFSLNGKTYFADPYGEARAVGVTLRLDVVLEAAEQVAEDLYNAEQTSDQFTLGVYQFNNDVSTILDGTTNGGPTAEATTDLTGAKTVIESYDYGANGGFNNNALLPALLASNAPNTNFPLAITHLLNGATTTINGSTEATNGTVNTITTVVPELGQVTNTTSNPAGDTASNPLKNIFIVTDGLEDSSILSPDGGNGLNLDFGEMTSITAENYYTTNGSLYNASNSTGPTGYCSKLKQRGFTVYVLYVPYDPLPFIAYYAPYLSEQANYADATDYPSAFTYGNSGGSVYPRALTQPTSAAETIGTNPDPSESATQGEVSPTEEALQACASKGDFYYANSSAEITTAMTAMLKSAINNSIVVTK